MQLSTLILGLGLLNGLILIHELGHYLAALRAGVAVPEFSVGFGPRLASFRWRQTEFSWRLVPLGGYVLLPALAPEDGMARTPLGARMLTILAGPLANLLLALLLLGPLRTAVVGVAIFDALTGGVGGLEVMGPVGISAAAGHAAAMGWKSLAQFAGLLSLNLAIFNLLPIPGLDGGRLLGLLAEKLNGGRRPAWEPVVQALGVLLLLGLGLWMTGWEIASLLG